LQLFFRTFPPPKSDQYQESQQQNQIRKTLLQALQISITFAKKNHNKITLKQNIRRKLTRNNFTKNTIFHLKLKFKKSHFQKQA